MEKKNGQHEILLSSSEDEKQQDDDDDLMIIEEPKTSENKSQKRHLIDLNPPVEAEDKDSQVHKKIKTL